MTEINGNESASNANPQQLDDDTAADAEGHRFHRTRDGGGAGADGDTEGHLVARPRGLGSIEDAAAPKAFGDDIDDTEGHLRF